MSVADRVSDWLPVLWFLLALLLIAALWLSGAFAKLIERMTKFGGFGLSFEFTEKSARETRESVDKSLGSIRTAIQGKLAADLRSAGLQEAFATVLQATDLADKKGYRATLHIPDPLFADRLYQLLDYYPKGGGAGRTFSIRTGIIGLAWRLLSVETWSQHSTVTQHDLVRQWGMTAREAEAREAADRKKLFLAMPLRDSAGAVPIAVFYLDAEDREGLALPPAPDPEHATPEQNKAAEQQADQFLRHIGDQVAAEFREKMSQSMGPFVEIAKKQGPQILLEAR